MLLGRARTAYIFMITAVSEETLAPYINDFARRCFRDSADEDYIAARLACRAQLYPQFQWLGLQAIEKLLKGILLFSRVPARDISHDLGHALRLINAKCKFHIDLSELARSFVDHLDTYGRFRYLETPWHSSSRALHYLDLTVWEIRRYCQLLDFSIELPDGTIVNFLERRLQEIKDAERHPAHRFKINGGYLEDILQDAKHPARSALIWKNLRFGNVHRRSVRITGHYQSRNSPLSLHPEILEIVDKYVYLPKDVKDAYRAELAARHGK